MSLVFVVGSWRCGVWGGVDRRCVAKQQNTHFIAVQCNQDYFNLFQPLRYDETGV